MRKVKGLVAIYFLANLAESVVKIGFSDDADKRVRVIKNYQAAPESLRLLWVEPYATQQDEGQVHRALNRHRIHGEWFGLKFLYHDKCCEGVCVPYTLEASSLGDYELLVGRYFCEQCQNEWQRDFYLDSGPRRVMKTLGLAQINVNLPYLIQDYSRDL